MESLEVTVRVVDDPDLSRRSKLVDLLVAALWRHSGAANAPIVDFGPALAVYDHMDNDDDEASRW